LDAAWAFKIGVERDPALVGLRSISGNNEQQAIIVLHLQNATSPKQQSEGKLPKLEWFKPIKRDIELQAWPAFPNGGRIEEFLIEYLQV
jgi:hypothetical protein